MTITIRDRAVAKVVDSYLEALANLYQLESQITSERLRDFLLKYADHLQTYICKAILAAERKEAA